MKILGKSILLMTAILSFCACSDTDIEDIQEDVPAVSCIKLVVDNNISITRVEPSTRGTNISLQDGSFAEGTEIGVFILRKEVYEEYLQSMMTWGNTSNENFKPILPDGMLDYEEKIKKLPSSRDRQLVNSAYPDRMHYGYINAKAVITSDGTISLGDGLDFIYPWFKHEDKNVALIAYAPYNKEMKLEHLVKGFPIVPDTMQSDDRGVLSSDWIVGVPEIGNTFHETVENVSVKFRHVMSKIIVNLNIPDTDSLYADTVVVRLANAVSNDTISLMQTTVNMLYGKTVAGVFKTGRTFNPFMDSTDIVMAEVLRKDLSLRNDSVHMSCSAIVLPQDFNSSYPLSINIDLKGRRHGLPDTTIVRMDKTSRSILSGRGRIYTINIKSSVDDDDHDEELPDDGKDDVILGDTQKP